MKHNQEKYGVSKEKQLEYWTKYHHTAQTEPEAKTDLQDIFNEITREIKFHEYMKNECAKDGKLSAKWFHDGCIEGLHKALTSVCEWRPDADPNYQE